MVNDRNQVSAQEVDIMFNSNVGTPKKNKLPFGNEENDFDVSAYFNQGSSGVAEMLGQSHYQSFYGQQRSLIEGSGTSGVGTRPTAGQQTFGRSMSIPAGHITPTSSENSAQVNQSRGILPMNRNSIPNIQMPTSGIGTNNSIAPRPGMPSPTRGISPIDMFSMKPPGNRPINTAAISRNHSFTTQAMQVDPLSSLRSLLQETSERKQQQLSLCLTHSSISAIGSESISQLRQQQQQNNLSQGGISSPASSMGIPGLNPFNLDQSEFPALAQRTRPIGSHPSSTNNSKTPYGMLSKQNENTEFQIHNEDFPALPGAAAMNVMKAVFPEQDGRGDESNTKFNPLGSLQLGGHVTVDKSTHKPPSNQQKGIQVQADNSIKHIPNSMLVDQYGIVGLFAFIKAAETDPTLVHLALGNDLTTLGLNLNSPDNLYHKFQSPFSRQPCRLQDIDFFVPSEYLTNAHIRDKLAPIKLNRYGEDLLFFVFYSNPGDVLQLAAAAELYNRDWRYHKEERIWITRAPGIDPRMKTSTYEQGTYYYFDCQNWRKVAKEFHLEYEKLEERPHLPNLISLHFNPAQHG
ncbi:CCR4-NOT transcription complex subunit 2 isoform X2 [Ciona intestinalis]